MIKARLDHKDECGTGREPDGGDLNLAIDAWILVCNEKNSIKAAKKKSSDEIEADIRASQVDRDNMKRSYLQKRNRDGSSSDEYSDISDIDDDLLATPSSVVPASQVATDQATVSTPTVTAQSIVER
jgi:hypothetical protein